MYCFVTRTTRGVRFQKDSFLMRIRIDIIIFHFLISYPTLILHTVLLQIIIYRMTANDSSIFFLLLIKSAANKNKHLI